jgi:O-antigen/teichoic acid export membrane protein
VKRDWIPNVTEKLERRAGLAVLWQALQHGGVQAVYLLRTLVLARLLAPDDFGLVAIATVAVGTLTSLTEFGMIPALVQRPAAENQHYDVAWTVNAIRGVAIASALAIAAPIIADVFSEPRSAGLIRLLALRPLLQCLGSIRVAELTRDLDFRALAALRLVPSILDVLVAVLLADPFGAWALVAGSICGAACTTAMSYLLAPYSPRWSLERDAARDLVNFGRWIFMGSVTTLLAGAVIQLSISRQLGVTELGLYYLAGRLAFLPHNVAQQVVSAVAFPLYSRLQNDVARASRVFRTVLIGTGALLLPAYALIIALAPELVEHVLGPEWDGTESIIGILSLVGIIGILGDVSAPLLEGFGRPQKTLVLHVVQSTMVLLMVWSLTSRFGVVGSAMAWLPAVAASQILSAVFVSRVLPRPLDGVTRPLAVIALSSIAGGYAAHVIAGLVSSFSGLAGLATGALAASTLIAGSIWALDRRFSLGILASFVEAFPPLAPFVRRFA